MTNNSRTYEAGTPGYQNTHMGYPSNEPIELCE
ncbi:hypothetical protein AGR3A_Lc120046 [Agrobacterium tomkonis CFBP 6623]|uniref:Uncharacterized protein n=1 Tax=Agrobacterium tomkonis CFBP 6623 TaxID=1183432 RepID=A0A1S7R1Q8_9HYPH|nr:hypothetical protein AGR3A_Lc120046 [Agrobacterium tomkonis CFBP 6623]